MLWPAACTLAYQWLVTALVALIYITVALRIYVTVYVVTQIFYSEVIVQEMAWYVTRPSVSFNFVFDECLEAVFVRTKIVNVTLADSHKHN